MSQNIHDMFQCMPDVSHGSSSSALRDPSVTLFMYVQRLFLLKFMVHVHGLTSAATSLLLIYHFPLPLLLSTLFCEYEYGSVVVKALWYKPEGRGFENQWGEFLNLLNPSGLSKLWDLLNL
jgi:hypothetical protein